MDDVHFLRTHAESIEHEVLLDSTYATTHTRPDGTRVYRFAMPEPLTHLIQLTLRRCFVPDVSRDVLMHASTWTYWRDTQRYQVTIPPGRYETVEAFLDASGLSSWMTYDSIAGRLRTSDETDLRVEALTNHPRLCHWLGLPAYDTWEGRMFPYRCRVGTPREPEYAVIHVPEHHLQTFVPTGAVYQELHAPDRTTNHPAGVVTHLNVTLHDRYGDTYDTDGWPFWIVLHARVLSLQDVRIPVDTFRPSIARPGYVPHAGLYGNDDSDSDYDE